MSDIERVIKASRKIETALVRQLGASGKGLNGKLNSVEKNLPVALVNKIRFIATIRNKVVHDDGYKRIDDRAGFKRAVMQVQRDLRNMHKTRSRPQRLIGAIVLLSPFVIYYIYYQYTQPRGILDTLRWLFGV